jgi:hypothetical protein
VKWVLWAMGGASLAACEPGDVLIEGVVLESRGALVGAPDMQVSLLLWDLFEFDRTTTGADGAFSLAAPRQDLVYLLVEGEGHLPISFVGESGRDDVFEVPTGQIWAFSEAEGERWRADFAGCPGVDEPGMVVGEVRLDLGGDSLDPTQTPIELFGFAFVTAEDDTRVDACYLNEEGTAYDPEAEYVGRSGRFAMFGVEGGPWTLTIGRLVGSGASIVRTSLITVPEGGVVSRHPALIDL